MGQTINPFGKKIIEVSGQFGGRELTLETGRLAFQASASVTARYGDTVVEAIVSVSDKPAPGVDFFPMSVDYEERFYAAGKISGSRYVKREGRPSEEAVLAGRLIDRPVRPLFPKGYHNEVQVVTMVLSLDPELRQSDIIAMIAASAALKLSGAPFAGPIAGIRVGLVDDKLKAFPTIEELEKSQLDLVVAGTKDAVMMVEAGAKEVSEDTLIKAIEMAHKSYQDAVALQDELIKKVGVKERSYELMLPEESIQKAVQDYLGERIRETRGSHDERREKTNELRDEIVEHFREQADKDGIDLGVYREAFDSALKKEVRRAILEDGIRPDNRKPDEIRALSSEVSVLPRAHGSSIFTRGSTQALNVTTLAPLSYAQMIDTMEENTERRFFHHYNMPGYSVGEIRRMGSPGRREIGHSALAQRALEAIIPPEDKFPYTIRTVTEIMSSNGSTSMAATCSAVLSMMDAGVPILAPVSGIAMGLITDKNKQVILSDIAGAEDFAGDMDFNVAGTAKGVTALQMDIKVHGITPKIMGEALSKAKTGRAEILSHMLETLPKPKADLSPYAPRVEAITINPEKIRDVIGKGGETINRIIAETGAEIDIKDDGTVMIASPDKKSIDAAVQFVRTLTEEPDVGKIYEDCRVVSVLDFGAFVEILPGKEGLVHVSELSEERVERPSDVIHEGDRVTVKLVAIDDRGRLQLSMKAAKRELDKK